MAEPASFPVCTSAGPQWSARPRACRRSRMRPGTSRGSTISLPAGRTAWEEAIAIYQIHAAPLDISYSKLVDVNYSLADLGSAERIDKAVRIPVEIRTALEKAAPVYRAIWWTRHDAANHAWLKQLRPQIEQYGPAIVQRLTAAFQHAWPTVPLRVEIVAYAQWAGAVHDGRPASDHHVESECGAPRFRWTGTALPRMLAPDYGDRGCELAVARSGRR